MDCTVHEVTLELHLGQRNEGAHPKFDTSDEKHVEQRGQFWSHCRIHLSEISFNRSDEHFTHSVKSVASFWEASTRRTLDGEGELAPDKDRLALKPA